MLALLLDRTDEIARVHADATTDETGHDVTAQALTIAHNGCLGLGTEVMDEEHAIVDGLEFLEKGVDGIGELLVLVLLLEERVDHIEMAQAHGLELLFPLLVALQGQARRGDEFVGDATQGTHHYDDRFFFCLDDALQAKDALYGTYAGSPELEYFHICFNITKVQRYKNN